MGNLIHSAKESKHVLICGLSQAGKTTLFNLLIYGQPRDKPDLNLDMNKMAKEETTFGFNFEYAEKDQANCIGFWDIGGKDTIRAIWSSFYKNIRISGLIFVVNANDEDEKIDEARMELQKLMNEEELRNAVLYVVFNNILKENGENGEQKVMEEPGIRNNILEEKIGFNWIHPSVIKQSILINLKEIQRELKYSASLKEKIDSYEKIANIKSWLIKQMEA